MLYKVCFETSLSYTCKLHIFIKITHILYMCVWLLQISEINIKSNMLASSCYTAMVLGRHRLICVKFMHLFLTEILDQKKRGTRS